MYQDSNGNSIENYPLTCGCMVWELVGIVVPLLFRCRHGRLLFTAFQVYNHRMEFDVSIFE